MDWWSFGILVFELVSGYSPFKKIELEQRHLLLKKIVDGKVRFPPRFSKDLRNLLGGLLTKDMNWRREWADKMKGHPWFRRTMWDAVAARTLPPPLMPHGPGFVCA